MTRSTLCLKVEQMTGIKENFQNWLTNSKEKGKVFSLSTSFEYAKRLNRLCKKLYENLDWEILYNDIYILRLLFMDSSKWTTIKQDDLDLIVSYLYKYKHKNRNFNDRYNQFFHFFRKELNIPLSSAYSKQSFFFNLLHNTDEYKKLSDWVRYVFVTEKSLKYLSWLYQNKEEKRKMAVALAQFCNFLVETKAINQNMMFTLSQQTIWCKRKNKSNSYIQIEEANGLVGRNFYSRFIEGKAEKLMSVQEVAQALGCGNTTVRRLLNKKKLNFKPSSNKIIAENVRRFLKRRHTKRSQGSFTNDDLIKDEANWVKMKAAEDISGYSATYIRKQAAQGRIAYTRYGLRKFLYFKPDLMKLRP